MSGLILCGKRAKIPYRVAGTDKKIYTAEEMSYYLYNNAYMTGEEFFDDNLISFLSDELEMKETAKKIQELASEGGKVKEMTVAVLESNSYYLPGEVREFERIMENLSRMTPGQRLKARADGLYNLGKYGGALKIYASIAAENKTGEDAFFWGAVWNNMGVIYEKMFLHEEALQCFMKAADLYPDAKIKERLAISAILCRDECRRDYISGEAGICARYGFEDGDISECERKLSLIKKNIMNGREYAEFVKNIVFDGRVDMEDHESNIRALTERWKNEYREESDF